MEKWNGFDCESFIFEGREAIVVFPKCEPVGITALKAEYWGAFPDVEIGLLEKGFHLAYVKNRTRFATRDDCDLKARFIKHIGEKYSLKEKCVPIGMSCGGAHAVNFAGYYPELVSCVYIDAPVLNFCSFPGKMNYDDCEYVWENEFKEAYPGIKRHQLLQFNEHPINRADTLVENKVPVIMVYGAEDQTVLYSENGLLLQMAYENTELMKVIRVACRGHHPHGKIGDNSEIIDFIVEKSLR